MPIYSKIQQVMQRVHGVEKASENQHARFKYAGHEAVTAALRGHFAALGIVREASVTSCDVLDHGVVKMTVRVRYTDVEDGTSVESNMPAIQPAQTKDRSVTAQQVGQALSYAVKNVEFKLFALTGDPEADSDSLPMDRSDDDYRTNEAADALEHEANAMLSDYERAGTLDEVLAITKRFRQEWERLKAVRGLADKIPQRQAAAQKRIKAAASRAP